MKHRLTATIVFALAFCLICPLGCPLSTALDSSADDGDLAIPFAPLSLYRSAHAQAAPLKPADAITETLLAAADAVSQGNYERAVSLALPVATAPDVAAVDRAEAWRLLGLARFFLERLDGAESAFVSYLQLEFDGRLDPALVPPEAVVFFEDVRARHAAELRAYRPKAKERTKRYRVLNLLPPIGQFQNGHRTKGWILLGSGAVLLSANIGSYLILQAWCDQSTGVCQSGTTSRTDSARLLRIANVTTGALFIGVALYGIYDGFLNFPRMQPHSSHISISLSPATGGLFAALSARF